MRTKIGRETVEWRLASFSLIVLALLVSACDGTRLPRVIASYPQANTRPQPAVVTEARLELSVADAQRAAAHVAELAVAHGGTVLEEQRWRSRDGHSASLSVLLPAVNFSAFQRGLRTTGSVLSERLTETGGYGARSTHVVVLLHETAAPRGRGWNPALTLGKAFSVFLRLFQALVDGLIWMLVVGGPFVLMGIGLIAVLRRVRQARSER